MALIGLEGTNGKSRDAVFIHNARLINKSIFQRGSAFTSAGDNGAINIWMDDDGFIRCESMRHFVSLDKQKFKKLKDVKDWASLWLKQIN